jgi:membrane-associated phospholipid phosphatase
MQEGELDLIKIIDKIGQNGPIVNFLITSLNLFTQKKYFLAYLISIFVNHYLNNILKLLIKEPRPGKNDPETEIPFYNLLVNKEADQYGMPSYHSQSVFFSTTFLYLVQKNNTILLLELVICFITLYQRYKYKRHDLKQLLIGAIVGSGFAYLCFALTNEYLSKQ